MLFFFYLFYNWVINLRNSNALAEKETKIIAQDAFKEEGEEGTHGLFILFYVQTSILRESSLMQERKPEEAET